MYLITDPDKGKNLNTNLQFLRSFWNIYNVRDWVNKSSAISVTNVGIYSLSLLWSPLYFLQVYILLLFLNK